MSNGPAELRSLIHDAWRTSAYPGDDHISAPTYDDEGVAAYFRGRSWEDHEVAQLRYHEVGLSFFTAQAFRYYLAAYMLAVLDDARAADVIYDGILFHLSPRQLGKQWADSYRARIAGLTPAQQHAICAYLEWCAATDSYGRQDIEATIAFLSTGTPPAAASGVDRLLQLGGPSDPGEPGEMRSTVQTLRLANTTVEDADLAALAELPALRELELRGTAISDAGLAQLPAAANLEILDLSGCQQISAIGLAHVGRLANLAELKLSNVDLDDNGLRALAPLRLRRLELIHARRITPAGWDAIDLDHLEALKMFGVAAPDAMLARLGRAGRIRELEARTLSDAGLVALCQAASLTALEVSEADRVSELGLAGLAALPALCTLQLGKLTAERWPAGFVALEELSLLDVALRATCAAGLAQPPALTEVRIFGGQLEPGVVAALARLPRLQTLTLWSPTVTDATLLELAGASSLETLSVHAANITGAGLAVVDRLAALATLQLDKLVALDDTALQALALAPRLCELVLEAVPITDAGLATLASCPQLRSIVLTQTNVTPGGVAAFRTANPAIEVVER